LFKKCTQSSEMRFAASWSEIGKVFIWDLNEPLTAVTEPKAMTDFVRKLNSSLPIHQFGHQTEGFNLHEIFHEKFKYIKFIKFKVLLSIGLLILLDNWQLGTA